MPSYYSTLPSGKIKYYWVNRENDSKVFLEDEVDGIHGVRTWLLDVIPEKDSILDIGCGPGHVSEIFKRKGRTNGYLGIDNDIDTIKLAKELFPTATFDCKDAHFLPYEDNSFDHCILFTLVEMIPDFRRPIEEAVRVAKKQVIVTTFVPMMNGFDRNKHKINPHGDYVVNINEERFLKHMCSFGYPLTCGTLEKNGKVQYWWWILHKNP